MAAEMREVPIGVRIAGEIEAAARPVLAVLR